MDHLWPSWQRVARELGGRLKVGRRQGDQPDAPHLKVEIEGVSVEAGARRSSGGFLTWVSADAPGTFGLRVVISSREDYPFADSMPIVHGDPHFDGRFVTKTNDAPFARLWIDDESRELVRETAGYHFVIETDRVRAFKTSAESDGDLLAAAIRAVARLAHRGDSIQADWRKLAGHLGGVFDLDTELRPEGGLSIRVPARGTSVDVDGFYGGLARRREGRGLFVRVRCPRSGDARDAFVIHDADGRRALLPTEPEGLTRFDTGDAKVDERYRVACEDPEVMQQRLTPELLKRLTDAGAEAIVANSATLTVFFLGFETDPKRVRAGVDLACALALAGDSSAAGPYR